jgi:hypothetical protein
MVLPPGQQVLGMISVDTLVSGDINIVTAAAFEYVGVGLHPLMVFIGKQAHKSIIPPVIFRFGAFVHIIAEFFFFVHSHCNGSFHDV